MIKFSDTTTKNGLVQFFEKEIGADYGDVSGDSDLLAEFVARANNAKDNYMLLWAKSAGFWQGDDSNHNIGGTYSYPIISANIVANQRDYQFTTDDNSNRITDVSKVLILPSASSTEYIEILPIDELVINQSKILINSNTGIPYQYGKLANSIFLDPIPNYSIANGIKMIVNREGSHWTSSDTDKTTGVPAHDEYFYLKPAYEVASIKGLANLAELRKKVIDLEGDEANRIIGKIQKFFAQREKDVVNRITYEETRFM